MRVATAIALLIFLAPSLRAEEKDPTARAKLYFETGRLLYKQGDYEQAAKQFNAGYVLLPRPQFLLNSGLCYQKLEQLDKARDHYQRFLSEAPPDDPDRERANKWLGEVEVMLAAQRAVREQQRQNEPSVAPIIAPAPRNSGVTLTAAPPPPRQSFVRRNWWIFPVAGVVVAGAVVGIVLGVRASGPSCNNMPGCLDFR
jgi:tetratricopeptide (TPR) repeat protein